MNGLTALDGPIFLGGEDRSGTTVLSVMLDSHPHILMGPELDFLEPADLGETILECCRLLSDGDARVQGEGVETRDPAWRLPVQFVKQCRRFGLCDAELQILVGKVMQSTGSPLTEWTDRCALIGSIGSYLRKRAGKRLWGMKIQRAIMKFESFLAVWPQARFLHLVRDGRDVAASHLRGGRSWGYRNITDAAEGWRELVDAVAMLSPSLHMLELTYERLVSLPREEMQRVLTFLHLPWNEAVLHHAEQHHALFLDPYHHPSVPTAKEPLHTEMVGRFLKDLSRDEIATFEERAAAALRRLGYAMAPPLSVDKV